MKNILMVALVGLFSSSYAFAYQDGVYHCKNADASLPSNLYRIQTMSLGAAGAPSLPYLEVTQYFKDDRGVQQSATIKGYAALLSDSAGGESMQLLNVHLEFEKGLLYHCQQ